MEKKKRGSYIDDLGGDPIFFGHGGAFAGDEDVALGHEDEAWRWTSRIFHIRFVIRIPVFTDPVSVVWWTRRNRIAASISVGSISRRVPYTFLRAVKSRRGTVIA